MKHHKPLLESCHGSNPLIETNLYINSEIKLEDMKIINRRFMGAGMSQSYAAIYWQEYYYEANRFEYVVEFGSQKGSLSTYFANMAAITEAFFFDTFEFYPQTDWYSRPNEGAGHWFSKLADNSPFINYFHQDVFDESSVNRVKENIDSKHLFFVMGEIKCQNFFFILHYLKKETVLLCMIGITKLVLYTPHLFAKNTV